MSNLALLIGVDSRVGSFELEEEMGITGNMRA